MMAPAARPFFFFTFGIFDLFRAGSRQHAGLLGMLRKGCRARSMDAAESVAGLGRVRYVLRDSLPDGAIYRAQSLPQRANQKIVDIAAAKHRS